MKNYVKLIRVVNYFHPFIFSDMDLKECCSQQLAELEMLQSMFENEREFFLEDAAAFSNVVRCANGEIDPSALITSVSFRVKLKVDPKVSFQGHSQLLNGLHDIEFIGSTVFFKVFTFANNIRGDPQKWYTGI